VLHLAEIEMKVFRRAAICALIALTVPASAAPAPRLHARSLEALIPLPLPYDEHADAAADLAAARQRAKSHNKLLLVDLGGNWCADCRILAGVMEQPEMRPFLQAHYETVSIDVGAFNRNMNIPAHYGYKSLRGVPAVLIIDPKTDALINRKDVIALEDARSMTPQEIANWLARWVK
jgi:thiol-disulfide isomerase/thioredoxin